MGDERSGWLRRAVTHPRAGTAAVVVAFVLALPTLGTGFILDDWMHRAALDPSLHHPSGVRGPWDLYRFLTDDPAYLRALVDRGLFPWWSVEGLRLAFLRPLASLSLALDHRVLGDAPALMHLENALWYAALAAAAATVYRRALAGPRVAALAALLFAVDHCHAMIVVWLSNRHALLSAVFAFTALGAHLRWRREAWAPGAWVAPGLYAVALACGESTLSILGYVAAWTLLCDPMPVAARVRALAPYGALTLLWAALYRQQACGAWGGDWYIDPVRQPLTFARAAFERAPLLLTSQLLVPPAEFVPVRPLPLTLAQLALLAAVTRALAPLVRADPTARAWLVGVLVALVPGCATQPNDRLLLFVGLGVMALLARAFDTAWWSGTPQPRARRALVAVLAGLHLAAAPVLLPARALQIASVSSRFVDRADASVPDDDALRGRMLVLVTAVDPLVAPYVFARRMPEGRAVPGRGVRLLGVPAAGVNTVTRDTARSLVWESDEGLPHDALGLLYRGAENPFREGARVHTAGMDVEVLSRTTAGRGARVRFVFDRPLEDPLYAWLRWEGYGFVPFTPPAVGGRVSLAPIDWLKTLAGD